MNKHIDCKEVCQQAKMYGVWPEHSCSPVCVWLTTPPPKARAVPECKDNDSPWLVCKPCNRAGKCEKDDL